MTLYFVQMAGAPGTGKSTLAGALAERIGATVINSDVLKSALLVAGVAWPEAGPAAYEELFSTAESLLAEAGSVIADSPSHYAGIPLRGQAIAARHSARYEFIECICPDLEEVSRRLAAGSRLPSQMTVVGSPPAAAAGAVPPARQVGRHLWETFRPASGGLVIDTTQPFEACLAAALEHLGAGR